MTLALSFRTMRALHFICPPLLSTLQHSTLVPLHCHSAPLVTVLTCRIVLALFLTAIQTSIQALAFCFICTVACLAIGCASGVNKMSRYVAWLTDLQRMKCVNYAQAHVPFLKLYGVYVVMSSNNDYDVCYRALESMQVNPLLIKSISVLRFL
jgi:hypothetical protein